MAKQTHVSASFQQDFLEPEKAQARLNIGAASTAVATSTSNGLLSSSDKLKLDSIQAPVQSDWNIGDPTSLAYIANKPDVTRYWMWNPSGNPAQSTWNDSTWTTITGTGSTANLIPNMTNTDSRHVITNFTSNAPEAFKRSDDSAWVLLKKGLWQYSMLFEIELVTSGSNFTSLAIWAQEQDPNYNYVLVRPSYFPTTNSIVTKYTRQVDGIIYVPSDPVYSNGSWSGYSLKFMAEWDTTDAEYRCRQGSFSLTRTEW